MPDIVTPWGRCLGSCLLWLKSYSIKFNCLCPWKVQLGQGAEGRVGRQCYQTQIKEQQNLRSSDIYVDRKKLNYGIVKIKLCSRKYLVEAPAIDASLFHSTIGPRTALTNNFHFRFRMQKSHRGRYTISYFGLHLHQPVFSWLLPKVSPCLLDPAASPKYIRRRLWPSQQDPEPWLPSSNLLLQTWDWSEQSQSKCLLFVKTLPAVVSAYKLETDRVAAQKQCPDLDWPQDAERRHSVTQWDGLASLANWCSSPEGTKRR